MLYSVYNPSTRGYDYYQTPLAGSSSTHAGAPARAVFTSQLGAAPEQASWSLPGSAKLIGSGPVAKGRIAKRVSLLPFAGVDLSSSSGKLLALGGLAVAYWWWRNR